MLKNKTYEFYKNLFIQKQMPLAFVDLDLLDENIYSILKRAGDKKIRIASKSIRCKFVLDYILKSNTRFEGIMCYTVGEANWLAQLGFDNLLIAYPSFSTNEIMELVEHVSKGKKLIPMIDDVTQAKLLNELAFKKGIKVNVCLDIDMSTHFPGIHFGVHRSPLHTLEDVKKLIDQIKEFKNISINGIMGYEAQVAGMGDNVKGAGFKNTIVKFLKTKSQKEYSKRRSEITNWLMEQGYSIDIVNAGGTGNLELSASEKCVTEVTAGSGFYSPGLFDTYSQFKHLPAVGFVLQIVRKPKNNYFTCLGGGYIASGETSVLKQPYAYLPKGIKTIKHEGFGEVQTPFLYTGSSYLEIGDPVIFRHAKAGELCEHFNVLNLVRGDKIIDVTNTYRGDGKCFL